jgi:hypothetical protein
MAHHDPFPHHPREVFTDRGEHFFRFRFLAGKSLAGSELENLASSWNKPLLFGETTRGMRSREGSKTYRPPRL